MAVLICSAVHIPRKAQTHLTVDYVGSCVRCGLLVKSRKEQVSRSIRVSMWSRETSRCGSEETVLCTSGIPEAPIPKQKVPGGVEGCGGVRADVSGMVMVSEGSCRVAWRLRGKRRLPRSKIVRAVVDFESAHSVCEGVDAQSHLSVRDFAC